MSNKEKKKVFAKPKMGMRVHMNGRNGTEPASCMTHAMRRLILIQKTLALEKQKNQDVTSKETLDSMENAHLSKDAVTKEEISFFPTAFMDD